MEHFKALGWKPKSKGIKKGNPQLQKIQALWLELHRIGQVHNSSTKALAAFCKRVTGVDRLEWLDGVEASKVIEALKDWEQRS
jgi:phage gp16-like protein